MLDSLKVILDVQEFDMKMIRLMRLRKERQNELNNIATIRKELEDQQTQKQAQITDLSKNIIINENKIAETKERIKRLEAKQGSIKKVDEFNALTQEMSQTERERLATEHATSDIIDQRDHDEEILEKIKNSLESSRDSSALLVKEIDDSIKIINNEGKELKAKRDELVKQADPQVFAIYERLLKNKKDRVVVPIETRTCSGCHIALTAQHENLVRKGERLIFCEHCSRILYWQESDSLEGSAITSKKRRRRQIKLS